MPPLTRSNTRSSPRKSGFFSKIKKIFSPNSSPRNSLAPTTSRRSQNDDKSSTFGLVATRTLSRRSMFGMSKEAKEAERERELEERRSRCLAIQAAKREPAAVQNLLVDCEFCNPPPQFGVQVEIPTPGFTAANANDALEEMQRLQKEGVDLGDERTWNVGLDQWLEQRNQWLTPTEKAQPQHFLDPELTPDRFYTVFDKLIYQTRPLKHPLNLSETIKILKAGWVAEGVWVGGSQNHVWTSSDEEGANNDTTNPHTSNDTSVNTSIQSKSQKSTASTTPAVSSALRGPVIPEAASESSGSSGPDVPEIHVQFSDKPPVPKTTENPAMPSLERVQSSTPLRRVRSSQSSMVSITDSE